MVDGLTMDKLFTTKQIAPTTAPPTTRSDANLASVANLMSSISNKIAAWSVNNKKEETIDYNNIPKDGWDQCSLKNDPSKIIAKSVLFNFSNKLTVDTAGAQQY